MDKLNIVMLDAKPLIHDDLCLLKLHALGDVIVYDRTDEDQLILRALEADILLVNKVRLNENHFSQLPKLRYIGVTATGVDNIDLAAAAKHHIVVTNVPSYGSLSVAQHVLALLLTHTNHVEAHHQSIQQGHWQTQPYFSYWLNPITELAGLTLGLLGFGQVAQRVAFIGEALGMNVIAHRLTPFQNEHAEWVSLTDLFQQSDVLSLHCPLTELTHKIINQETLGQMKATAILINTSRGSLVDEPALATALKQQQITAAYLDVLSQEPPHPENPLLALKNCIITPHMAWASVATRKRLLNIVCENIIHYLNQEPIHMVQVR